MLSEIVSQILSQIVSEILSEYLSEICPNICPKFCPKFYPNICPKFCPKFCPKNCFTFLQNIKCDTQSQNRPPVGRNLKHVSLQTTRLWGLSCTVRHAISKTTPGRSKFQIRVGTYNSCLEPAYLRSQLPSNSDFPISWSFALSLLLKFRSISNAIVYCSLKIKPTFLGISRKYFKDLFKKISSAAHGAKKIAL